MPTNTFTDQITISLNADGSVRGINVYAIMQALNADGSVAAAVPMPPRDAVLADVTNLLAPSLVTQQEQITSLTEQLATATTNAQTAATQASEASSASAAQVAQLQAQTTDLTAQLSAAQTALTTAQNEATASAAQVTQLQAQLTAAQAAAAPATNTDATDALLSNLNGLFATIPTADQAEFASVYATVRVLVQAGQPQLAATVVQGLTVQADLTALQAQIVALLTPTSTPG